MGKIAKWGCLSILGLGGLVVILAIGVAAVSGGGGNGGGGGGHQVASKQDNGGNHATKKAPKTYQIGDTARVGDAEWTVNDAYHTTQLNSSFGTHKRGNFVVIDFTFTNYKNEEVTLDPELHMTLKDDQGRKFGAYDGAYEFIPNDRDIFLTPVNPNVPQKGTVVYQVAPDAKGLTFKGDDLDMWKEGSVTFDLSPLPTQVEPGAGGSSASATASASASAY